MLYHCEEEKNSEKYFNGNVKIELKYTNDSSFDKHLFGEAARERIAGV